jgi:hypothetical protein
MAVDEDRTRYPDERLDDKFDVIARELEALRGLPQQVGRIAEAQNQTNGRLDRMRADAIEDTTVLRNAIDRVGAVQAGFFSALLVAIIAAVIVIAVAL